MNQIGLQLWSIREEVQKDLLGTLGRVAEIGYQGVQFAGFFDVAAEDVKAKLDEVGLQVTGAHVPIEQLENQFEEVLKYHETIDNHLLIIPSLPGSMRTTEEDYLATAKRLDEIGRKARSAGFTLAYHNHDFEFDLFNGKTGFELLFNHTDANHLKIELDCFWASYTKNDPKEMIEQYGNRIVSLHIKDLKIENDTPISTELGTGILPLTEYIEMGKHNDVQWFIVEQEHFTNHPLDSAKINLQSIREMMK